MASRGRGGAPSQGPVVSPPPRCLLRSLVRHHRPPPAAPGGRGRSVRFPVQEFRNCRFYPTCGKATRPSLPSRTSRGERAAPILPTFQCTDPKITTCEPAAPTATAASEPGARQRSSPKTPLVHQSWAPIERPRAGHRYVRLFHRGLVRAPHPLPPGAREDARWPAINTTPLQALPRAQNESTGAGGALARAPRPQPRVTAAPPRRTGRAATLTSVLSRSSSPPGGGHAQAGRLTHSGDACHRLGALGPQHGKHRAHTHALARGRRQVANQRERFQGKRHSQVAPAHPKKHQARAPTEDPWGGHRAVPRAAPSPARGGGGRRRKTRPEPSCARGERRGRDALPFFPAFFLFSSLMLLCAEFSHHGNCGRFVYFFFILLVRELCCGSFVRCWSC